MSRVDEGFIGCHDDGDVDGGCYMMSSCCDPVAVGARNDSMALSFMDSWSMQQARWMVDGLLIALECCHPLPLKSEFYMRGMAAFWSNGYIIQPTLPKPAKSNYSLKDLAGTYGHCDRTGEVLTNFVSRARP